ncbi:hypothetical protein D3C83_100980 [compost metagenome]
MLRLEGDRRAQAEDGVGGQHAGGNDRGNQRQPIAHAGDIAVAEARPIEAGVGQQSQGDMAFHVLAG